MVKQFSQNQEVKSQEHHWKQEEQDQQLHHAWLHQETVQEPIVVEADEKVAKVANSSDSLPDLDHST